MVPPYLSSYCPWITLDCHPYPKYDIVTVYGTYFSRMKKGNFGCTNFNLLTTKVGLILSEMPLPGRQKAGNRKTW